MRRIVLVLSVAALMVAMVAGPAQAQQFVEPPCPAGTISNTATDPPRQRVCLTGPPYIITSPDPPEQIAKKYCKKGSALVRLGLLTYGCALLVEDPKESGKNKGWGDGIGGGRFR
jgi:hypothetical protein